MAEDQPDERHDQPGWSIERFGARCFLSWHDASIVGDNAGRVEIDAQDFRAARDGKVAIGRLLRKYDRQALTRGLENPSLRVKVFLLASFIVALAALIAVLSGWST